MMKLAAVLLCAVSALPAAPALISYMVGVSLPSNFNTNLGYIDFQFNGGGGTYQPAWVEITNFLSDGTTGVPEPIGPVSGDLSSALHMDNDYSDFFVSLAGATALSFDLRFGGDAIGAPATEGYDSGSSFGFALYGEDGTTPLMVDPLVTFALAIDVNAGSAETVPTLNAAGTIMPRTDGIAVVTIGSAGDGSDVPEPASAALIGGALTAVGILGRRRRRSRDSTGKPILTGETRRR